MQFKHVLSAELLKLKRTIALKMVVLAPVAVVLLTGFMASQAPVSTLHVRGRQDPWLALARVNLQFWALLMMPLYIALQSALIAGLDHADNQWKAIFARPIRRWTVYVAKLTVLLSMLIASGGVLLAGILTCGFLLPHLTSAQIGFGYPPPAGRMLEELGEVTGLAFLALAIQHWVSLRWRSFSIATGAGIVATVTSFAMLLAAGQYGAWPEYFPWALPMLPLARGAPNVAPALWWTLLLGIAVTSAGCVDFSRRELT